MNITILMVGIVLIVGGLAISFSAVEQMQKERCDIGYFSTSIYADRMASLQSLEKTGTGVTLLGVALVLAVAAPRDRKEA
jgi:uncharacterized membrane protein